MIRRLASSCLSVVGVTIVVVVDTVVVVVVVESVVAFVVVVVFTSVLSLAEKVSFLFG